MPGHLPRAGTAGASYDSPMTGEQGAVGEEGAASTATAPGAGARLRAAARRTRGRISYNALARLAGRGAGGLLSLYALHLATHYFGPRRWGAVVAAVAYATVFVALATVGVRQVLARDLARGREDEGPLFGAGLVAATAVTLPVAGLAAAVDLVVYATRPAAREVVFALLPLVPLNAWWAVSAAVLIARSRNDLRAVLDVLSSAALVGGVLVLRTTRGGTVDYALVSAAATAVTTVAAFTMARRHVVPAFRRGLAELLPLARRSVGFALGEVAGIAYAQLDTILVSLFTTASAVAWFGVGSQVAGFVMAVPGMLTVALVPHYMRADRKRQQVVVQRALDVLLTAAAAVPVLGALFSQGVVVALAGPAFLPGSLALALLLAASAFTFPSALFAEGLVLEGQQREALLLTLAVLCLNLAGNLVAIPLAGIAGAALVMVATELASWLLRAAAYRRATGYHLSYRRGVAAAAAAGATAAIYEALRVAPGLPAGHGIALVLEGVGIVGCYGVLLVLGSRVPGALARRARIGA